MGVIIDAFRAQSSPWETPADFSALTFNKFGGHLVTKKGIVSIEDAKNIQEKELQGTYHKTIEMTDAPIDNISFSFRPYSALFLHYMLGKTTGTSTSKTITNMDGSARKPRMCVWSKTENKITYVNGVVIGNTVMEWSEGSLTVTMIGKGLSYGLTTDSEPTRELPKDESLDEVKYSFNHLDTKTWNGTSLNILQFSHQLAQSLKGFPDESEVYYEEISEFIGIGSVWNLNIDTTSGEALKTDYDSMTPHTFITKFVKPSDPTQYIQFSQECYIVSLIPDRDRGKATMYNAVLVGTGALTITSTDAVAIDYFV